MRLSVFRAVGPLLALLWLVAPGAAAAQWLRAESANFVIYTDVDARAAERLSEQLEMFDQVLRLYHGLDPDEPVRRKLPIYLLRRSADLQKINPGIRREVRGFYASTPEDTYAVAVAGGDEDSLRHEYVHHFMLARYPFGYAGWLVEGYAEYFMTFRRAGGELEIGGANTNRATWLVNERWIPFETVLTSRPSSLRTSGERALFYAQAWGLTHWFLSDPARRRQLDAYNVALGRGEPSAQAMKQATGLSPDQLGGAVKAYLTKGFTLRRIPAKLVKKRPVTVTPLTRAAGDVLLPTLRIKNDNGVDGPEDKTDGPALLATVRRAAEPHLGDRLADLALARAELKLGDLSRAEGLLQARISADPNDYEALQLLAAAQLRAATASPEQAGKLRQEAQTLAGRAHKLNPDYYPTLAVYAEARGGTPRYPSENDVNVLLDALDLAPQVAMLRHKAAAALIHRDRHAEALRILRPIAFDPHGGEAAAAARDLMRLLEPAVGAPPAQPAAPGE